MRKQQEHTAPDYVHWGRGFPWRSDHNERFRLMASAMAVAWTEPLTVCDPACGDGSVVMYAHMLYPFTHAVLGDLNAHELELIVPDLPFKVDIRQASLFETLNSLHEVDTVILTEILEHLPDPDLALRKAAKVGRWLVASSPIVPDGNDWTPEHLWAFDKDGYRSMIEEAGWHPVAWTEMRVVDHPYNFQIWIAKRAKT